MKKTTVCQACYQSGIPCDGSCKGKKAFNKGKKTMPVSPGRPKGSVNKTTALLKDAILMAAEQAGKGDLVAYLKQQAVEQPVAFMSLLGKVLPMQVTGDGGGPVQVQWLSTEDDE